MQYHGQPENQQATATDTQSGEETEYCSHCHSYEKTIQ
jgi:hypothetical protein